MPGAAAGSHPKIADALLRRDCTRGFRKSHDFESVNSIARALVFAVASLAVLWLFQSAW